ncbi:ABC transporter substrate-binding protein [Salsipaludibacter albus]|uniref:ABC transporter substrate-binding protein n=1 Tax=Salsipaludibacter albus TaxID=2849650 RepID=UPI001EE3A3C9|nr:peptide ABC transporter substrate-binding protein [Salsipaludibacter albus]
MRTRRRLIAAAAAAALVITACGGGDEEPADTTDTETSTDTATDSTETSASSEAPSEEASAAPAGEGEAVTTVSNEAGCAEDYPGKIGSIEATDTLEVVFTLCSPDPAFLQKVAFIPFAVQPSEHIVETGGAPLENPIGTGPFALDTWNRGSELTFTANADYWGDAPAAQSLVFRWATESAQRITELQSGTAQYATTLSAPDYELVEGDENLQLLEDLNPNVFYMGFNNTYEPFTDKLVRQAIAMGIDRQRIVDTYYPTGSEVPDYFTPCQIENACVGDPWYDFDPEAARNMLAEAGYPDGFDTTIYLRDVYRVYLPEPQTVAQEIQTQLSENLGINAEIEVQESGAFIEAASAGELDGIHLLGWGADYPHVTNFLDYHFAGNEQFGDAYTDIVDTLAQGAATVDVAEAEPIYTEANNLIRDEVPMVPIAHGAAADAAVAGLGNAASPPFGAPQFDSMTPEGDSIVFVQNAEPISLFCTDESDGESLSACEQVLEGLYQYDLEGNAVPALAEECAPNEDGTVWTCSLREGVTFHDGSEFDATDVVTTWSVGIDAASPLHVGNTGGFEYYTYLWGGLMNAPPAEDEG